MQASTSCLNNRQCDFVNILTGGCIGGGGLPQSRDADILSKRMNSVYSMDEKMIKRKSHENEAVKGLYKDLLEKPMSHVSHKLLHTHYHPRPRLPPITLKAPNVTSMELGEDSSNTIYVIYGTQSGTAAQAAKEIKIELQQFIGRSKLCPEPTVSLVAGDMLPPNSLLKAAAASFASIFVTCTFGEGEFPETMQKLWSFLESSDGTLEENSFRYAVFGLGSSMYAAGDQFNRAARRLDKKLEDIGAERIIEVGLGDDQSPELYRGEMDRWMETLLPKLFGKNSAGASWLDPPEPLFRLSLAPGKHSPDFFPLPPNYHFITLESVQSVVTPGYSRPAAIFTFDLEDTGMEYDVGDHLALLPRNPEEVVDRVLSLYAPQIHAWDVIAVETVDRLGDSPFPSALTARELLTQYLDLCGRPSRTFLKQLFLFANSLHARENLRSLFQRDSNSDQSDFELYTDSHT
jgi:sulfite reductase alpha subunit-like flavoprotein